MGFNSKLLELFRAVYKCAKTHIFLNPTSCNHEQKSMRRGSFKRSSYKRKRKFGGPRKVKWAKKSKGKRSFGAARGGGKKFGGLAADNAVETFKVRNPHSGHMRRAPVIRGTSHRAGMTCQAYLGVGVSTVNPIYLAVTCLGYTNKVNNVAGATTTFLTGAVIDAGFDDNPSGFPIGYRKVYHRYTSVQVDLRSTAAAIAGNLCRITFYKIKTTLNSNATAFDTDPTRVFNGRHAVVLRQERFLIDDTQGGGSELRTIKKYNFEVGKWKSSSTGSPSTLVNDWDTVASSISDIIYMQITCDLPTALNTNNTLAVIRVVDYYYTSDDLTI